MQTRKGADRPEDHHLIRGYGGVGTPDEIRSFEELLGTPEPVA